MALSTRNLVLVLVDLEVIIKAVIMALSIEKHWRLARLAVSHGFAAVDFLFRSHHCDGGDGSRICVFIVSNSHERQPHCGSWRERSHRATRFRRDPHSKKPETVLVRKMAQLLRRHIISLQDLRPDLKINYLDRPTTECFGEPSQIVQLTGRASGHRSFPEELM